MWLQPKVRSNNSAPGVARPAHVLAAPRRSARRDRHAVFPRGPHVCLACLHIGLQLIVFDQTRCNSSRKSAILY
ncbi:unnamed protein product, partial [Brenthis ino]